MESTNTRWQLAQSYEKNWWADRTDTIDLTYLQYYAEELIRETQNYIEINESTNILEIGSGPAGILTFLPAGERHAIDPLEYYFSTVEEYISFRDKAVMYQTAMGEELPYEDNYFDFIIIDNVLDHCQFPSQVISEMSRVVKYEGIIYFRQNIYHPWGKLVRELMEFLKIDKGHPHTFLKSNLEWLFKQHGFSIQAYKSVGYYKTWKSELLSSRLIDKIKALLFATRNKTLYILKKN